MSKSGFHPEFQEVCLATIWRDQRLNRSITVVKPSFFDDPASSHLSNILKMYWEKYAKLPSKETSLELVRKTYPDLNDPKQSAERNSLERKIDSLHEADISDFEFIKDRLKSFARWKAIIETVHRVVETVKEGEVPEEVVDWFGEAMKVGDFDVKTGLAARKEAASVVRKEVDPDNRPRRPTGLTHFDQEIGGGLRGGELGCLLAPPKGFKSGTLLNFAFHGLKRGVGSSKKVLYLTLELSEELQVLRFVTKTTGLTKDKMVLDPDEYIKVFQERSDVLFDDDAELYVAYFPPYVCTPSTIRSYLDMMRRDHGVIFDSIMIDYLDLMGSDVKSEKDYLEKVRICTDLRAIAVDYNVPIWTACRATREATGKRRISMAHMAGAFERVAICDLVVALCQTDAERVNKVMRLVPVATRNDAGNRQVICNFEPEKMSIWSVEARDLTDEDFEEDDGGGKRHSGGGGGGGREGRRKKDDDSAKPDDDEAIQRGLKKLNELRKKAKEKRETAPVRGGVLSSLVDDDDDD